MFESTLTRTASRQRLTSPAGTRGLRRGDWRRRAGRRSGIAILYTALGLAGFLGASALVVDMGNLYTRRAQAQRAADAAALAGATQLPDTAKALAEATAYARLNGYNITPANVQFKTVASPTPNQISVLVQRQEPLYFLPAMEALLGGNKRTSTVGATAVAESVSVVPAKIDISPPRYGTATGVVNPSIFGPYGPYEFGDPYSPLFLTDGTPNTAPPGRPEDKAGADFPGYEYELDIASDYITQNGTGEVQVDIFDPDCYSADGQDGWDEIRGPQHGSPAKNATTTRYTLKDRNGNTIAEAVYSDDPESDMKWTTPPGFKFNINEHGGPGPYKLIVKAEDGSSENGFQFRAGKPHDGLRTEAEQPTWEEQHNNRGSGNGTKFWAVGKTPMNFRRSGDVTFDLGFVPGDARGGTVYVDKFDTDVGSQSVTYKIKEMPGEVLPPGTLASNGAWGSPPDRLSVPTGYPTSGSVWSASYVAGAGDTSCWTMRYSYPGGPGMVRLID